MTQDRQAEREAQAIAAAERIKAVVGGGAWYGTVMCQRETNPMPLDMRNDACKIMYEVLAATERAVWEEAIAEINNRNRPWYGSRDVQPFERWLRQRAQEVDHIGDANKKVDECVWTEGVDDGWATSCGEMFLLLSGTPTDNKMAFCCYCGKPLKERRDE